MRTKQDYTESLERQIAALKAELAEAQRGNWEVETAQAITIEKLREALEKIYLTTGGAIRAVEIAREALEKKV